MSDEHDIRVLTPEDSVILIHVDEVLPGLLSVDLIINKLSADEALHYLEQAASRLRAKIAERN